MSNSIHLCNGEILYDPEKGLFSRSLTIEDSLVTELGGSNHSGIQKIDLEGHVAVPGFIDSHLHLTYGASGLGDIDLSNATCKKEFVNALAESAAQANEGSWIIASGWSEQQLGEIPNKTWLEELPDTPVICYSLDLHTALINDSAIELLDMKALSLMPGSEFIEIGLVKEDALFEGISSVLPDIDYQSKISRTRRAIGKMHEQGITLVGTMETTNDVQNVLLALAEEELMRFRVMCLDDPTQQSIDFCSSIDHPYLQVTGFKSFLDGSLGSRTAKMYEPWCDDEGNGVWAGVAANNTFSEWLSSVTAANYSPIVHAIGDQAVGFALDSMADISSNFLPRIEHAQFISNRDMEKVAGKCFGVQPLHQPFDLKLALKAVGSERIETLHNWRTMVDVGATLSFGSDWPVAAVDPIAAMNIAIQKGLSEREVLMMSTSTSSDSLRTPQAGRLTVGSYGDVVILDRHPFKCDWNTCPPSVIMTIVAGEIVYQGDSNHA